MIEFRVSVRRLCHKWRLKQYKKKIVKLLIMAKKNLCVVIRNKETSNS